ncbi:MAG: hypothetical protein AAFV43_03035 [Planctomycetota bacterium]
MNAQPIGLVLLVATLSGPASASTIYSQTQSGAVGFPDSTPVVLTFTGAPEPATDATLSLVATGGELANNNKRLEQLTVDGDTFNSAGQPLGWVLPVNFLDGANQPVDPVTIPLADLAGYAIDGQIVVSVVRPGFISGGRFDVTIEYTSAIPEPTSLALFGGLILPLCCGRRTAA